MKVLFIGGTGIISTAVSALAVKRGIELYVLNRGHANDVLPAGVQTLIADMTDEKSVKKVLQGHYFDSIVQWIAFTKEQVERDYRLFKGYTDQYVFISSASAYQKPLPKLPITEAEVPLDNPYWQYSENKKICEEYLLGLKDPNFHVTIIRPSHTYNEKMLISQLNSGKHPYTLINRMLEGKPIIIPDKGLSLWTLTYNADFAHAFVDILGNPDTYEEFYHLTGDKVYTWERINEFICQALDVTPNIIHIPTDFILKHFPEFKGELYGDKKDSTLFDNSKIKSVAPNYRSETEYSDIVKLVVKRFKEHPELQTIDEAFDQRYDACIKDYLSSKK
ncbi:MAG: SDR family oxidoreductase [Acholeplasmataceae bacterium]